MTYRQIFLLVLFLSLGYAPVMAQGAAQHDSLTTFIKENPNAVDFAIIYEGTCLYLSADDENLLVNVSVAQPALQMRLMMMPMKLYIDPTGKKKRNYEVTLPSALDVKDELEAKMDARNSSLQRGKPSERSQQERPDIQPLIGAMNANGAEFNANGQRQHLGFQRFYMELDREHDLINYYLLLPKQVLMQAKGLSDKWTIGIVSNNDMVNMPPPEEGEEGMAPPPMEGDGQEDIQQLLQGDIRSWTKFSIDDVNNANIKNDDQEYPVETKIEQNGDSINVMISVHEIETQLTFLMQGLSIRLEQTDSLTFFFPSAPMVRSKVRRHPNEVKAVLAEKERMRSIGKDTVNQVVRPDVQPLVAALNDTTATIVFGRQSVTTRCFHISVDREKALMTFMATFPMNRIATEDGNVTLTLSSQPISGGDRAEYEGRRLSGEQAQGPRGLGEGLRRDNAASRIFKEKVTRMIRNTIR